jgi:hypothetical protein
VDVEHLLRHHRDGGIDASPVVREEDDLGRRRELGQRSESVTRTRVVEARSVSITSRWATGTPWSPALLAELAACCRPPTQVDANSADIITNSPQPQP